MSINQLVALKAVLDVAFVVSVAVFIFCLGTTLWLSL